MSLNPLSHSCGLTLESVDELSFGYLGGLEYLHYEVFIAVDGGNTLDPLSP